MAKIKNIVQALETLESSKDFETYIDLLREEKYDNLLRCSTASQEKKEYYAGVVEGIDIAIKLCMRKISVLKEIAIINQIEKKKENQEKEDSENGLNEIRTEL